MTKVALSGASGNIGQVLRPALLKLGFSLRSAGGRRALTQIAPGENALGHARHTTSLCLSGGLPVGTSGVLGGYWRATLASKGHGVRLPHCLRRTILAANCHDGGFEMWTIFHGASPNGEMFAGD